MLGLYLCMLFFFAYLSKKIVEKFADKSIS